MSSTAIMTLIKEKERDLEKLLTLLTSVRNTESSLDCYSYAFNKAASAMEGAGTIGGKPIDDGKTKERANQFSNLTGSITSLSQNLKAEISILEEEIESLYIQYNDALRREEEERIRQEMLEESKRQQRARIAKNVKK